MEGRATRMASLPYCTIQHTSPASIASIWSYPSWLKCLQHGQVTSSHIASHVVQFSMNTMLLWLVLHWDPRSPWSGLPPAPKRRSKTFLPYGWYTPSVDGITDLLKSSKTWTCISPLLPGWSDKDRGLEQSEVTLKVCCVDDSHTLPEAALGGKQCPHSIVLRLMPMLQKSCPMFSSQSTWEGIREEPCWAMSAEQCS